MWTAKSQSDGSVVFTRKLKLREKAMIILYFGAWVILFILIFELMGKKVI